MRAGKGFPLGGSCRRRRLMRGTPEALCAPPSSVTASPCHLPPEGEGLEAAALRGGDPFGLGA